MTPQQKAARTRAYRQYESHQAAEEAAKAELIRLGYGPRFYAGKHHAIKGLKAGETYRQDQFPGGHDSWQAALADL
jgi:hypothetical protein